MAIYELSISPDYVSDWGFAEAVREIIQNGLDQEELDSLNKLTINWVKTASRYTLRIQNKLSALNKTTLLLGSSSKRDDDRTIGQFGEGYKLACLVLLRLGKQVSILNYAKKELWTPVIEHSSKFGAPVLKMKITKYLLKTVPDGNLTWLVRGISEEEMKLWRGQNLVTNKNYKFEELGPAQVLTEEKFKGQVFVRGLYVGSIKDSKMRYGYNLPPTHIKLDRDRKQMQSFDLFWSLSQLWGHYGSEELCTDMLLTGAAEVQYLYYAMKESGKEHLYNTFIARYGKKAIPVYTQEQIDTINALAGGYIPIVVSESTHTLLSHVYVAAAASVTKQTPKDILQNFKQAFEMDMSAAAREALTDIITKSENWRG